jgi:hypothetical protein
MESLNTYLSLALSIIAVILLLFPRLRKSKLIKRILVSILVSVLLFSLFTSNWYLHWRNYDEEKIKVHLNPFPHVIKTETNQIYSYFLKIENHHPPTIKISNVNININSKMPVIDNNILLSDCNEDSVNVNLKNKSNLAISISELNGGDVFCLSFRCNSMLEDMPEKVSLFWVHIPFDFSYELFSEPHTKSPKLGTRKITLSNKMNGQQYKGVGNNEIVFSNKKYNQKDMLYEKAIVLDHRKVFDEPIEYQYGQYLFDNNSRSISIYCSSDKFIIVKYDGLCGVLKYKSEHKICPRCRKVDIIRVMVFKNDFFLLEASFGFKK